MRPRGLKAPLYRRKTRPWRPKAPKRFKRRKCRCGQTYESLYTEHAKGPVHDAWARTGLMIRRGWVRVQAQDVEVLVRHGAEVRWERTAPGSPINRQQPWVRGYVRELFEKARAMWGDEAAAEAAVRPHTYRRRIAVAAALEAL